MDTYHIKYLQRVDSCKNVVEEDRVLIDSHKSENPGEAKQRQQNHRHFYTASGREKEKKTTLSYSWVFSPTACVVIGCFEIT